MRLHCWAAVLRPPEHRIHCVADPDDDGSLSAALGKHDVAASVVVAHPVPGISRAWQLAVDILMGLGKGFDALEREDRTSQAWPLIQVWLRAERVQHLVVLDADRLPARLWHFLADVTRTSEVQLWLVCTTTAQSDAPDDWRRSSASDMLSVLSDATHSSADQVCLPPEIRHIVTPAYACAMTLSALAGLAVDELIAMTVGDLQMVSGPALNISSSSSAQLRAQVLCRASAGAGDSEALFIDEFGRRASSVQLAAWMRLAAGRGAIHSPRERLWPHGPQRSGYRLTASARTAPPRADIGAYPAFRRPGKPTSGLYSGARVKASTWRGRTTLKSR